MGIDDAYAELELARGATEVEVKRAWRRLVSQWHPDRNPSTQAVAKMQRLNQAFELLKETGFDTGPTSRAEPRSRPKHAARETPPPTPEPTPEPTQPPSQSQAKPEPEAPPPVRTVSRKIKLSLEEAAAGCLKVLRGRWTDDCPHCHATGTVLLDQDCPECEGVGQVRQRAWYGFFGPATECVACQGDGHARAPCGHCEGSGKLPPQNWQVTVRIPHGVKDGDLLHVDGRASRAGHARVSLDLRIDLLPHPLFKLAADGTVRCEMPVNGFAWIAQRTIDVPTLVGLRRLVLQRDQLKYRLPGLGYPRERRGAPADMVIRIQPQFPDHLTEAQEGWIDHLIESTGLGQPASEENVLHEWARRVRDWQRDLDRSAS